MGISFGLDSGAGRGIAALAIAAGLVLGGCATQGPAGGMSADAMTAAAPEADRQAILAMTGSYDVTFEFEETVAIAEGYELKDPYISGADEYIFVLADEGDFISLQHLLVVAPPGQEPFVVKHWRQDWVYQPDRVLAFHGQGAWEMEGVPEAERAGAWSQTVYQVDDSPRYAGYGRWEHRGGASTWASNEVWRPLPRRDDTTRTDYQVMECVNRHTITPWGWSQEEDNAKVALSDGGPFEVVREIGTNSYVATDAIDVSVAEAYWDATEGYWASVRSAWALVEADGRRFEIADDPWGADLYVPMLEIADRLAGGEINQNAAEAEAMALIRSQTSGPAAAELAAAY